jgi:hypothetical protein
MRLTDIYASTVSPADRADAPSPGPTASRDVAAKPAMAQHAVTISWIGMLLALVLLRVLYEFGE